MDVLLVDLEFITWWHRQLMYFVVNWRAGWPTSGELSSYLIDNYWLKKEKGGE
jgi:hypothetical protein